MKPFCSTLILCSFGHYLIDNSLCFGFLCVLDMLRRGKKSVIVHWNICTTSGQAAMDYMLHIHYSRKILRDISWAQSESSSKQKKLKSTVSSSTR